MSVTERFDRKNFLTLALGSTAALAIGCSDDPAAPGGSGGSGGAGGAPVGGSGGSSAGSFNTSGSGGAAGGSGGTAAGSGGTAGTGGASGGSGGSAGGAPVAPDCGMKLTTTITSNHMHVFEVTAMDVMLGVEKIYDTKGQSNHPHWIKLTAADFTKLKSGGTVRKLTCNDEHEHEYIVNCVSNMSPATTDQIAGKCEANRECADTMGNLCPELPDVP